MKLVSLEIKGFKSFVNHTIIHFNEDVIGIVGPNGSGKSNIVDAIRWVLGEQKTKELRLEKMSSVIFNGTKNRKEANMASVSLTFENTKNILPTEYNIVTITRVLYRSGDSEYRLNNVPCRLKDIHTLLMDTGIGSDSYAIIALGMVDDILNDKENSRRKMLEQAAGVSKYKSRKLETLQKLESTQADLNRIEDLLFEIEANLKTLEKQAKRTQKYFDLKAHYKTISITYSKIKIESLKIVQNDVKQKITVQEDALRQFEIEILAKESELEKLKKTVLDKEMQLSSQQKELNALVAQLRTIENDKKILQQKIEFNKDLERKLSLQIDSFTQKNDILTQELDNIKTELVTEERIESRLEIEFEEKELELAAIRLSYNQMKSSVENQQQIQSKLEKNIHDAQRTLDITNNQIIVTKENIERVASDFNKKEAEKSKLNIELETNAAQKTEINTELESLKKIETERLLQIDQFMQSIKELDTLIIDCNRNLDAKQNEHDLLKNMVENLEGYPDSIKYLSNKITAPLLSDLLYVKQEYRVAIENYLENYLNYFVADHEEVALDAIQQLDKTNKGKANFFLLNHFNESSISTSTESEGNIRALDVIEFDAKYKHLFHYLFENVNIVEKITTLNGSNILIQRDAKVINDGKKLSGGSIGIFEGNKIGRKINLNRLVDEINILKKKQVELSDSMKVLKQEKDKLNLQSYNNKIQQLQVKLTQLNQNEAIISTKINSFQSQLGDITAQQSQLSARLNEFQDTYQKFELTINDLRKELESVTQNSFGQKEQFSKESQKIQAIQTEFNELNIKLIRQQGVVNNIKNNISFKNKQLEQNHTTLLENTEELKKISQSISLCEDGIISYANNLQNLYAEREKSQGFLSEFEQSFFKDRTRISNLEDEIRKTSRISQENIALVNQLKDKQNEIKYQVLNIADRLSVEFSIDINDVINTKLETQEVNEKELIVEIDKLKSKIDNFGEINPLAVEAYNEMKIRFDEIQSQKNDIDEARISLKETIDEIEQTATKLFLDAFNKVRENFQNVFRHLFSEEDSCDLILLDPEKPLESVIQITAKPKGKRPQSISQLSGGEKTLTATALLFSLYLLKPAPFCIFDEVDAPLDDANIEKFNKIIKEFSKESQFIIVTHNKQTMSAVDTIYGIYMQEQGVSAVSGVDFKSFKENGILESSPN